MNKYAKTVLWIGFFLIAMGIVARWSEIRDVLFVPSEGVLHVPPWRVPPLPPGLRDGSGSKAGKHPHHTQAQGGYPYPKQPPGFPKQPGGIPGVAGSKAGYPQWGVRVLPDGIIKASNRVEKMKDISMGYFVWLKSRQAAENFLSSQHGFGSL
jgi:hypothetical protein